MGVSAAVAVAVVGGASAQRQQKKAASKEKEGRRIARAGEAAVESQNLRQQVREERVKRAQILAAAESSGVAGASSEAGSLSALKTSVGSNIAFARGQTLVADAVSRKFQSAADTSASAQRIQGATDFASQSTLALDAKGAFS